MRKILLTALIYLGTLNLFAADSENYFKTAMGLYRDNHYQNAIQYLKTVFEVDGKNWRAHQLLGYCRYLLKDKPGALEECRTSLKLHGDNPRLEIFIDTLEAQLSGKERKHNIYSSWEGKAEAQMPTPPDQDPDRKADVFLEGLVVPQPTPKPTETFFLKTGGGLIFLFETNSPIVDQIISRNPPWTATVALGTDCPDHFSFFLSGAWLPLMGKDFFVGDGVVVADIQYTVPLSEGFKPYLYEGLGISFTSHDSFLGFSLQSALGLEFKLDKSAGLFVEGNLSKALNPIPPEKLWQDTFFPVFLTGFKFKL